MQLNLTNQNRCNNHEKTQLLGSNRIKSWAKMPTPTCSQWSTYLQNRQKNDQKNSEAWFSEKMHHALLHLAVKASK